MLDNKIIKQVASATQLTESEVKQLAYLASSAEELLDLAIQRPAAVDPTPTPYWSWAAIVFVRELDELHDFSTDLLWQMSKYAADVQDLQRLALAYKASQFGITIDGLPILNSEQCTQRAYQMGGYPALYEADLKTPTKFGRQWLGIGWKK